MKNSRKKDLRAIRARLLELNKYVIQEMSELQDMAQDLYDALEEQFDNLSERSQENEVGEKIQDDMNDVEYIVSDFEDNANLDPEDTDNSPFSELFDQIDSILDKE